MMSARFLAWVPCRDRRYEEEQVWKVLWTEFVPPNPYAEILTPSVAIFGDRGHKEIIKLNKVNKVGGLMSLLEEISEMSTSISVSTHAQKRRQMRPQGEGGHLQARRRGLTRNQP